jgi:hypothetical protein
MNRMIKCEGCHKPAKYLVHEHEEPHCLDHMLEAVESRCWTLVRCIEDATSYPDQSE